MKIDWNDDKNEWLMRVRGIFFEDVLYHLSHGGLLDLVRHTNTEKYPDQFSSILHKYLNGLLTERNR